MKKDIAKGGSARERMRARSQGEGEWGMKVERERERERVALQQQMANSSWFLYFYHGKFFSSLQEQIGSLS